MAESAPPISAPPGARPIGSAGPHSLAGCQKLGVSWDSRTRIVGKDAVYAAHDFVICVVASSALNAAFKSRTFERMAQTRPLRQPLLFIAGAAYSNDLERPSPTGSIGSRRGSPFANATSITAQLLCANFARRERCIQAHGAEVRRQPVANGNKPTLLHSSFIKDRGPRH